MTAFSKIIRGELPCAKICETDRVFAFMALHAIRPGHALVVPKDPEPKFFDLDDNTIAEILRVAKRIGKAIEREFSPQRVGLIVAGFDIPHAHLHVVPMHEYHDITSKSMLDGLIEPAPMVELETTAAKIRRSLDLGVG